MLWRLDSAEGEVLKSPSTYKANIEDTDNDSYTSVKTAELIDTVIATGMLKLEMTWDYCTEEEAYRLMQVSYKNPLTIWVKCPAVKGGTLVAPFRVSKRVCECISTAEDASTDGDEYKVSYNLMQKKITDIQKETVEEA